MQKTEGTLRDLRTVRLVILVVSAALAVFGLWKRSEDLDDLAFVQEQAKHANSADAPVPSAAMQRRLERDHRTALLEISQKERELREPGSAGATVTSLQDGITRDVQQMLLSASSRFSVTDTAWLQFEDSRVQEVRRALAIDLILLPLSLAGLVCGGVIWMVENKRERVALSQVPPQ